MIKKLINNTASPVAIADVGQTVPASSYLIIDASDYDKYAQSSDVIVVIADATLTVNDGSFDLSIAQGVALIQGSPFAVDFTNNLKNSDRLKVEIAYDYTASSTDNLPEGTTNLYFTNERAQDAVGATLTDTATIDFTYNDAGNAITADLKNTTVTAASYGSATQVPSITVDAQGRLTAASNTSIAIPSTQITDFTEAAQDAVGASLTDTAEIDFTYNDVGNSITADLKTTTVTAGSYGSATQVPNYTVDSKGRLTAATNTSIQIAESQVTNLVSDLAGKQPLDATLTSLAAYNTNGILTQTAADTFTGRTLTAGTGISITNGDGVSGNPTITSTITQYTNEDAQDAVGNILTDTSSIDFTYNDAGNTISAVVLPAGIDHNSLQNYVANQHIDHSTVSISAGTGLTGGGDITTNRTLNIANTTVTAASYGSATQVPTYTVNAQGQLTAAANATIAIPSTAVTDFNEAAQDAVGTILTDTASIDFTYNDAGNTISAAVLPAGVNHNALQNYVANQHIDHSTVSINAGTGLTGGGDITTTRSISMPNTGTAGTYGSATQVPVFTTDAQGRVTSVTNTDVTTIFGSQFQKFEDLTTATTTSATFSVGATFTTASIPAGTYRIGFFYNWALNATNIDARLRLMIDGVQVGPEQREELSETTNQSINTAGFVYSTFGSTATHTIAIEFAVETAGGGATVSLFQTRAEIWRVS